MNLIYRHFHILIQKYSVRTGQWVGDCFIYTNSTNRLNYLVGDQTYTISHFDTSMYLLGYIPRDGRLYLANKDVNIVSFALSLSVVEYQTVVLRGDMEAAAELLEAVPLDQRNKIARFLEGQGYKELALEIATDPEHRFDLALALGDLDVALEIARETDAEHKWKTVGDAALAAWNVTLAEECFKAGKDLSSLLLLRTSTGDVAGLRELAELADEAGLNNIAFSCLWQIGDVGACVDLLTKTGRTPEAALLAKTYKPSLAQAITKRWKAELGEKNKKVAEIVAVPGEDEDLFPGWDEYLAFERNGEADLIDVDESEAVEEEE